MQLEIGECFEDINDALKSAVKILGGNKTVGALLRPELASDAAGDWLRDCLNPSRREKLSPEQALLILRLAREKGYHAAMDYLAFHTGYRAEPVDPVTQEAQLQREFIAAVDHIKGLGAQLERLQRVRSVA